MKAIIEIIKEKIETGKHDVNLADYKSHVNLGLIVEGWAGDIPDVGEILTDGNTEMEVIEHVVNGDSVGLRFDKMNSIVTSHQVQTMINDGIITVK